MFLRVHVIFEWRFKWEFSFDSHWGEHDCISWDSFCAFNKKLTIEWISFGNWSLLSLKQWWSMNWLNSLRDITFAKRDISSCYGIQYFTENPHMNILLDLMCVDICNPVKKSSDHSLLLRLNPLNRQCGLLTLHSIHKRKKATSVSLLLLLHCDGCGR